MGSRFKDVIHIPAKVRVTEPQELDEFGIYNWCIDGRFITIKLHDPFNIYFHKIYHKHFPHDYVIFKMMHEMYGRDWLVFFCWQEMYNQFPDMKITYQVFNYYSIILANDGNKPLFFADDILEFVDHCLRILKPKFKALCKRK